LLPVIISNVFRAVTSQLPKVASRSPVQQVQQGYGGLIKSNPFKIGAIGAGIGAGGFGVGSAIDSAQQSIKEGGGGIMLLIGGLGVVFVLMMLLRSK
tara:strand:- start:1809 stop:2099 length:291 start_codon:yes stop_codon:yes gene_type:complete